MSTISATELQCLFSSGAAPVLLDVRTPLEFAEVHVPEARNVPLDGFDPCALGAAGCIFKDQPVYLLCRSGARAASARAKLMRQGFEKGIVVEGGTLAWIAAGLPVERGTVKVMSLERQVRIAAGSLVVTGLLLAHFVHPAFIGLSAFVGCGLIFAGITDWCGMGLLLAKAPWNARTPSA